MRYGAKSPAKRIILISVSCLVAVALVVTGIAVFMNARTANAKMCIRDSNTHALHSGPSDLSVVTAKLSDGDTVRILEHTSTDWTRIALEDGPTGYCDSALLSIRGEEDSGDGTSDVGETLRPVSILSAPDAEAPAVGKLAANVYITLLSAPEDGAYTEVTVNSPVSYTHLDVYKRQPHNCTPGTC